MTTPDGARTTYLYNEENLLSRIKYADGAVVRYTYDANGNRIGEEDENGAKTTFVYDALGRVVEVNGEEGHHYAYRYDGEGNLIEAEDALGNRVSMEYDGNGNLIKETNQLGESRSYAYTPLGDVESITDEAGRTTCYQYQKGGLLEKIRYADRTEEAFTYDANGNLETHTLATGFVLTYGYDSMDRIVEIMGSEGEKKSYTYDALGNVTSMTDGEGNITRYAYTLSGQLAKVTDALGNETEYQYDVCDRLIEIRQYGAEESLKEDTEGSGMDADLLEAEKQNGRKRLCQITRYTRDLRGQVTETVDALGQKETYTYDKKGQLLGKLDKEGYLTKYAYTKQGDLSGIQYADGKEVKLSYNPLRQLIEIQDWLGNTRITPDALGRAEKVQYPDGREVSYTYGKAGERRSITYPDGKTVFYGYDEQLRLSKLKEGDSIITYGYDPVGRLCEKQFPNGTKTTYRYDRKDQLTELLHQDQGGILDRYTYLYDLLGHKTGITKERRGLERESGQYRYGYDALGRLSEIQKDGEIQTRYGYDAFGNRTWKEESGERKQEGVLPKEKLEKLDPQRRVGMEIGNSRQITYTLDLTRQYYNLLERTEESQSQRYFWDGNVAAYEENGERNYYLQDELGSPLRIEDSAGTIKESYGYGAFGEDLYQNQGKMQPFGYTGYQRDSVSGTYYAQAREYLAESGRFAGQDLIVGFTEYPKTLNRYNYCWNNSLIYVDYDGKFPTIIAGAIIGGVVSFTSSIVTQVILDRKVNWKETFVDTVGGAIKGGIAGSGIGIVGGVLATGATGAATSVASQIYADDKKMNEVDWRSVVIAGGIDAVTYGTGKYKIKGKGPTVQEQLRKTNDDVYNARLYKAGYGKKRQHGKSYQRAIKKVSELKKLQRQLAKKWLNEKTTDGIKEIEGNFGKKLQEKIIILQLQIAPGINNVERCEA